MFAEPSYGSHLRHRGTGDRLGPKSHHPAPLREQAGQYGETGGDARGHRRVRPTEQRPLLGEPVELRCSHGRVAEDGKAVAADWPTYRGNSRRSGYPTAHLRRPSGSEKRRGGQLGRRRRVFCRDVAHYHAHPLSLSLDDRHGRSSAGSGNPRRGESSVRRAVPCFLRHGAAPGTAWMLRMREFSRLASLGNSEDTTAK